MAKVLGVGGVFFKSPDPKKLYDWYAKWLGMEFEDWGVAYFPKNMPANSQTVWSAFDATTKYFDPSEYGSFGWFLDPEGNKVELWEPVK
jgi:catechol 2,3-dioxygenase-like lactoylglutathione lyase family enzyme